VSNSGKEVLRIKVNKNLLHLFHLEMEMGMTSLNPPIL
jgi:hypothetical protein